MGNQEGQTEEVRDFMQKNHVMYVFNVTLGQPVELYFGKRMVSLDMKMSVSMCYSIEENVMVT